MIHPRIRRIPAVDAPLSADAFIIEGDARYYVFDVGASDVAHAAIAAVLMGGAFLFMYKKKMF